ncbi:O-acyltransferase WSD1-like [Momordica charantia]|uniref:O-acyltransferase WSD1-like n=1 Tax=Momordica charantia TaxID=3673 RepID=A0A6J1D2I7_MOMCH|nr:O-acyltransferase WSD1-like [Momordica charantia]XP_022147883.1 O-acyltransferase WSD1-like [Momordica charantia]
MEILEDSTTPMSPLSQYFNTSEMCVSVLGVLELESPISPPDAISIVTDVLLPANPRFTSIMVKEKSTGERKWKTAEVNPRDHIYVPTFPNDLSPYEYDAYFDEYATKTATKPFSQSIPLWEIHVFNYPTSHAACSIIFKVHHSIADGFCLMNTLLSCLKRADDPSLPLTFPSRKHSKQPKNDARFGLLSHLPRRISSVVSNFGWSVMKNTFVEDDPTPIKPEGDCMQLVKPIAISTMTFSLDQIKQIKNNLNVSINDVLTGIIFIGVRLYMQEHNPQSSEKNSSALILLNTRKAKAYKSVKEMLETDTDAPWGNRIAFLPVPIPKLIDSTLSNNPLEFVKEAKEKIMLQRNTLSVFMAAKVFDIVNHVTGPEVGAKLFKRKLKNSSIMISSMIGPLEKMALANRPVKGLYFTVPGMPQSLLITIVSYMGDLRIVFGGEKCFIDQQKLKVCIEDAFKRTLMKAAKRSSI